MSHPIPSDPVARSLALRGHTVRYTDEGQGPTFVLVHGVPGSVADYRYLEPALRDLAEVRVVRLEMPGFGGTSSALVRSQSVAARGGFIADVLDALELEAVTLAGHSMGGPAVLAAAARSQRVTKVVLLASVGLRPHRLYRRLPLPTLLPKLIASRVGRLFMTRPLRSGFVKAGFSRNTPAGALYATMDVLSALRFEHVQAEVSSLRDKPVLLFCAEDDPLIETAIGEELAGALGGALTRFEVGGHNIQKTQANALAKALLAAEHRR